ncbi:carbohydrate porin [Halomonas sp. Bachu 37]|uniref:carbohydrate porin n=1 Tax=Halomonas kashgarensis TaxID=3084920 RepID=UPI003216C942
MASNGLRYGVMTLGLWAVFSPVQANSIFDSSSAWMLGDWNGKRSSLEQQGVEFNLGYISESAWNAHGGYNRDRTVRYSDQWTTGISFDLDTLFGLPNASFQFTLTNRNGDNLTTDRLVYPESGSVSSVQEVYGRGNVTRITQLWYRQQFFDEALDVKLGRIPVSDDFATFDSRFQNLYLGSAQPGNQAGSIWYNWPVSQWATRVRWNATGEHYVQMGLFDLNPSNLDPDNGLDLKHSGTTGALIPVEFGWTPELGSDSLPGQYKIGGYYSTAGATDYTADREDATQSYRMGLYYVVDQQITTRDDDVSRGLSLFSMSTWNDRDTAYIDKYVSIGMQYKGPFDARPKDDFGIGLAWANVNEHYDTYMRRDASGGQASPGPRPAQSEEYNAEIYYGFHVADWLVLRPNLQYVIHPGGVNDTDNALVGGLMVEANL